MILGGNLVVEKNALAYVQLTRSKESGTFTGRSELRLELTVIVANGKLVSVVTGDYEATGKSHGASTAKRTIGRAALGALIGAAANGGKGAAIVAGVGAGAGAGSEIVTRGRSGQAPSETLIDFTLQQYRPTPFRAFGSACLTKECSLRPAADPIPTSTSSHRALSRSVILQFIAIKSIRTGPKGSVPRGRVESQRRASVIEVEF